MRNFILFIRRFSNLLLFLLLEVVCVVFIARTNTMQGNDIMSSANLLIAGVYQQQDDVAYYFALKSMNDSLISENIKLREQVAQYQEVDTLYDSTATCLKPIDSIRFVKYADYTYRYARIINKSVNAVNNYITINRGEQDGIRKNMAVVSANGTVGRIVHTSAHFSSAISVLSKKQAVSAGLKDGTVGHVTWAGYNPNELMMNDVPQQIHVAIGDSVFTTEYSFFPPNVLVGTVFKKERNESKNLQVLYIKPATDFRRLQYVYVVENKMTEERDNLENKSKGN